MSLCLLSYRAAAHLSRSSSSVTPALLTHKKIDFEKQLPVEDLPGISIRDLRRQPEEPFDLSFELISGSNRVRILGEVKRTFAPNVLQQISGRAFPLLVFGYLAQELLDPPRPCFSAAR